jgi:hypothetical protein
MNCGSCAPPVNTGMAAGRLQAYIDSHSAQADIAEVKQNRIIAAIQEFVSPEEIPALMARIEGGAQSEAAADSEPTDVEEFDPDIGDDDDDDEND